jgi:hypothetical protein
MNRFKDAIDIQNACNISGVARHLVATIDDVFNSPDYYGTTSLALDPAVRLVVHKLADMCGVLDQPFSEYARMYVSCEDRAKQTASPAQQEK